MIGLAGVAVAVGVGATLVVGEFAGEVGHIAIPPDDSATAPDDEEAVDVLVMGSDSREQPGDFLHGSRSDVMMLAHIPPPDHGPVRVMSIYRDLWVELPGRGAHKINAATAFGGPELAVRAVEDLVDTHIDHTVLLDFAGFREITDAIGGVDLDNPREFDARGHHFDDGPIHVDGEDALTFVRERYEFDGGDFTRVDNQQLFLRALLDEVFSREIVTNPVRLSALLRDAGQYLWLDDGLTLPRMVSLASRVVDTGLGDVEYFAVPVAGVGTSDDGQSIVLPDVAGLGELRAAFDREDFEDYLAGH
ncbi:LytR family transcriptional regulator [Rhodococcus rhodnii LMG 5362]|uniref:LytR family transcriptional regulator n=2 Tax=Rhodococcus rhodnii TaxID=38312 RepID=R7WIC5_9NOCA|nr:LytR family transcriptional regulator [Rhodococcus rhodnii LMG 5362]